MNKIDKIVTEAINDFVEEIIVNDTDYKMQSLDELYGYMWLKPNVTNIDVDMFVDDGEAYIRDNHAPLLFVRNGKGIKDSEFIPISISDTPIVLDKSITIKLNHSIIESVINFIKENKETLLSFANGKINAGDFTSKLKVPTYAITECKEPINEMATLRKKDSNLPMDIWLDEGATYQGHAPRIKFRASKEQRTTREFSSMQLTNPPKIENLPQKLDISTKDIQILEKFVITNMDLLLKLANNEIDYTTEFLPNMVKV